MAMLTAAGLAALLIVGPSASDATRLATNGGFLLGNAHRCGIASDRIVQAGQLIRELIAAATEDGREQDEATNRFAALFIVSAAVDDKESTALPSCRKVAQEFARLEKHSGAEAKSQTGAGKPGGQASARGFRLGDGE